MGVILPNIFRNDQIKSDSNPELERPTHSVKGGGADEGSEHLINQWGQTAWRRSPIAHAWGAGIKYMNGKRTIERNPQIQRGKIINEMTHTQTEQN